MTLFEETCQVLVSHGKTSEDVRWVGSRDGKYAGTWRQFEERSRIEYDSGFGSPKVLTDLIIVGDDWWLERGEYDGSEWWEFKTLPRLALNNLPLPEHIVDDRFMWVECSKADEEIEEIYLE